MEVCIRNAIIWVIFVETFKYPEAGRLFIFIWFLCLFLFFSVFVFFFYKEFVVASIIYTSLKLIGLPKGILFGSGDKIQFIFTSQKLIIADSYN